MKVGERYAHKKIKYARITLVEYLGNDRWVINTLGAGLIYTGKAIYNDFYLLENKL